MQQKLKWALIIFIGVIFLVSLFYLSSLSKKPTEAPRLVSSLPANSSKNASVFESVILEFDGPLSAETLSVTSVPSEDWVVEQRAPNTLSLNHSLYLRVATAYELTLWKDNEMVTTLSFTTTQEQNDPRFLQGIQKELDRDYPLVKHTPYDTALYYVVYSAPLTLEITIKNEGVSTTQAVADIKSWVSSQGGDAATHQYVVTTPNLEE